MAERARKQGQLESVRSRLACWREAHGGRGRPIPVELWRAAADVAGAEGVEATARALGVDRGRLARHVEQSCGRPVVRTGPCASTKAAFVEMDAGRVFSRGEVVVRLTGRDGEQLEIAFAGGASSVEVASLASALWRRAQ